MTFKSSGILLISNIQKNQQINNQSSQDSRSSMNTAAQLHTIADKKNAEMSSKVQHAMQRIRSLAAMAAEKGLYEVFLPYVSIFDDYVNNVTEVHEAFQNTRKAVFMKCKEEGFGIELGMNALGRGWLLTW